VKVVDGVLSATEESREEVWRRYRRFLSRREGAAAARIKRGYEFKLIAQIIEDGSLPFAPSPVDPSDLREPATDIVLRDYQMDAWRKFLEYGAIGVFYPFGTGKSFLGVYACAAVKGPKLVVVPTRTLKEQWSEYLRDHTSVSDEVQVETYRAFNRIRGNEYVLTVFDEVQHLPANQFIRLATVRTKYRIGFSGSPYREDGRVNYIIALTGFPVGLSWEKFFELGIIRKPSVTLFIVGSVSAKLAKLRDLLSRDLGKTIVFCDGIALGKRIARMFGLTFVYGSTVDRLSKIRENDVVVVSRVGDEGISIPDVDSLIEVDFLFGSRMQESQRVGRLLHSQSRVTNHYILMTEEEYDRYSKRLYALYERGFRIDVVR